MKNNDRDVVIVGAGAAGLTAGIVLARAQADVLIVDDGQPRNAPAEHMHGFVSRDGAVPAEFLAIGREEVAKYGGGLAQDRVTDATRQGGGEFSLALSSGLVVHTRAVLVTTGLTDELPDIPGVSELWGSQVHHCPHCHGFEVRRRELAVIGGDMPAMTLHQAALLRRYSDQVTLYVTAMELSDADRARLSAFGVGVVDGTVSHLVITDDKLTGVGLDDGAVTRCDSVFIAPEPRPNAAILRALGCEQEWATGWVVADATGATSVPRVWAAGNVVNPRAQVITAAGEASAAAIAITSWLLDQDVTEAENALREFRGGAR